MYLGEYRIDDFVSLVMTTHRFSSGAAFAPSAITYRVYEDSTATEIVADTAMTNFDSETGLYLDRIQCTAALGYEAGKTYTALIKATVDSISAIAIRTWRVLTPPVNVVQIGGDAQSATDLKDFADAGYDPGTNKVQGVVLTDTVTTYTGDTPQTGDSFARLGAPAGASVSADIAAIEAQTDDIGAAGAGLTALASAANLATVAGYLDTEIAEVLADTNELQTDWVNGGRLDLLIDAIKAKTDLLTTFPSNFSSLSIDGSGRVTLVPAQIVVKKNTALAAFPFLMVDATDFATPETGLTVTAQRSLDGAAFGNCANSVSEVSAGIYKIDLAAADLNATTVTLKFTATGAATRFITILTQP